VPGNLKNIEFSVLTFVVNVLHQIIYFFFYFYIFSNFSMTVGIIICTKNIGLYCEVGKMRYLEKANRYLKVDNFVVCIYELPAFLRIGSDYFTENHELTEWIITVFSVSHKTRLYVQYLSELNASNIYTSFIIISYYECAIIMISDATSERIDCVCNVYINFPKL
jgi:hypothetical protein